MEKGNKRLNVKSWHDELDAALAGAAIDDDSVIIALCRNTSVPLESADAWAPKAVVALERDEDDVDLIVEDESDNAMTVRDLQAWFGDNTDCGACHLFVPEPWQAVDGEWNARRDVPVVGPVLNSAMSAFGVMVWYEGIEDELE